MRVTVRLAGLFTVIAVRYFLRYILVLQHGPVYNKCGYGEEMQEADRRTDMTGKVGYQPC